MPVSQFDHKQPTRFNAPEIDQDLATKLYVDNAGIVGAIFFLGQEDILGAFHGIGFYSPFDRTSDSSEFPSQMLMSAANILARHFLNIQFNTHTVGTSEFDFRDDGATANNISVAFGVTGHVDSGALAVAIAAGSLVNFRFNTSTGDASILLKEFTEHIT